MNGDQQYPGHQQTARPFRRAVWRGLAALMPPLLTVLIIVWTINTIKVYMLEPVTGWAREGLVWHLADVRENLPLESDGKTATGDGRAYRRIDDESFIPQEVYNLVRRNPGQPPPITGEDYYRRYVDLTVLRPYFTIPFFLAVFVLLLYFLGKFITAGVGGFVAGTFDKFVLRVPGVRAVYSAVKQVSDFLFTQREIKYTRIVAVEYPRKGMWSIGFVTGENFAPLHRAGDEMMLTVFVPYSPMPVTGCTVLLKKSECLDLDVSFDQACQFIVSCGVVVPPQEIERLTEDKAEIKKLK
ncbi:MAG: DUF502 domain-containing protein [Pirellulales bacterium]|nr:DUF502 domain-containing protein [Pirellulales bacterium]